MIATVRLFPAFSYRLKVLIVLALLMLSLGAGVVGTTTQVSAARRQPKVACVYFSQAEWIDISRQLGGVEDPGPGGYWDCNFV